MSVSDALRPDGSAYDPFLHAEVGEDATGAPVTVLSVLARLGLEPWTEARELALLDRDAAQVRLKTHFAAISDVPALATSSGSVATKLVSLLPKRALHRASELPETLSYRVPRVRIVWVLGLLIGVLIVARIYVLAHTG